MRRIKICFIGNPESPHVNRWAHHFESRGFDVAVLTYTEPHLEPGDTLTMRFVRARPATSVRGDRRGAGKHNRFPGLRRVATFVRYRVGGFYAELNKFDPDLVHGHYVSDYGFLAAMSGRRPLVVSAWGSDVLIDPHESLITRRLVQNTLRAADLVTYDAEVLADAATRLGAHPDRLLRVVAGVDLEFQECVRANASPASEREPVVVSLRSLGRPLFNIDVIIRAMPEVLRWVPRARLQVGNEGALQPELEKLAAQLGVQNSVEFTGWAANRQEMASRLCGAAAYVSIPSSDGTSVTLLEAMACGAYPIVSDLPANREWISDGGGEIVGPRDAVGLAAAIVRGLTEPGRRKLAAEQNANLVRREGLWETNMARLEAAYRQLAGDFR